VLNKIMVIGNLGSDPEMRYTPSGVPVTTFRIATSRKFTTRDGESREETEWFRVVAWNRLAEQCNQYLTKGRRVYAEGRLKSDTWVGNDGQNRFTNEINAFTVLFLDSGGERSGPRDSFDGGEPFSTGGPPPADDDDLPW
jgi:single-strand DNA-binding protein